METIQPDTATGLHGAYYWLSTNQHDLSSMLSKCPFAFVGKFIAVTSLDSGSLRLTPEYEHAGWQSRDGIAYSPKIERVEGLPVGGFDEWYVSPSPLDLGLLWRGNVFEAPHTREILSVFVNFGDFGIHNPELEGLLPLFWEQMALIQPESYVADGNKFLTFVSRNEDLFGAVSEAFRS